MTTGIGAPSFSTGARGKSALVYMHLRVASVFALQLGTFTAGSVLNQAVHHWFSETGRSVVRVYCCFCCSSHSGGIAIFDAPVHGCLSCSVVGRRLAHCLEFQLQSVCATVMCLAGVNAFRAAQCQPRSMRAALLFQVGLHGIPCLQDFFPSIRALLHVQRVCNVHSTIWQFSFMCSWWFPDRPIL